MGNPVNNISEDEIKRIVNKCILELLHSDCILLENDVSERAITHKLAEYIQQRIPNLNVDCEYNRNVTFGYQEPKKITLLRKKTFKQKQSSSTLDNCLEVSTYPDIIVHRRGTNNDNLLVIEVKKQNSNVDSSHDRAKLKAFTQNANANSYNFKHGLFVLIKTGETKQTYPELEWFV